MNLVRQSQRIKHLSSLPTYSYNLSSCLHLYPLSVFKIFKILSILSYIIKLIFIPIQLLLMILYFGSDVFNLALNSSSSIFISTCNPIALSKQIALYLLLHSAVLHFIDAATRFSSAIFLDSNGAN